MSVLSCYENYMSGLHICDLKSFADGTTGRHQQSTVPTRPWNTDRSLSYGEAMIYDQEVWVVRC